MFAIVNWLSERELEAAAGNCVNPRISEWNKREQMIQSGTLRDLIHERLLGNAFKLLLRASP